MTKFTGGIAIDLLAIFGGSVMVSAICTAYALFQGWVSL